MSYLGDLWAAIKGDFVALDVTEAAILGAPNGETLSLYDALAARHGSALAHLACVVLSFVVEPGHCANQIAARPMGTLAYIRAGLGVVALAFIFISPALAVLIWRW
jgi:hypothetical protein